MSSRVACVVLMAGTAWGVAGMRARGEVAWRSETAGNPAAVAAILEAQRLEAHGPVDRASVEAELRGLKAGLRTAHRMVVSFSGALTEAQRSALEADGIRVLSWLGGGSYFATVQPGRLDPAGASGVGGMRSIQEIRPEWKMHPALAQGPIPDWAVLNDQPDPMIGVYAVFHDDVSLADARAVAALHGAQVRDSLESINALVLELPESHLTELVTDEDVQWVEPPLPRMSGTNAENRALTQADLMQVAPYDLDGTGVTVMEYDAGTAYASHVDLAGHVFVRDFSGEHYHSTHVAGTIGGNGTAIYNNRGMAPGVTIESYGFEYDGTETFLYTNPGDIESDYSAAFNTYGAVIANNSIGTNTETNGFPCSIQGDYGVTSQLLDEIVDGSLGVPVRICWAAGNERQGSRCDVEGYGQYYSSAPPSLAKNTIGVGAVNSNDDSMTSFSSWGPADDGRLKPDICAPGCQSNGDFGVTSCDDVSTTAYRVLCGTSMATPTTTGCSALLLEDYKAQFPARELPMNSTLKALLIQGAVDRGNVGPDYQFGWGSIRIKDTIDFMRTDRFVEDMVDQDGTVTVLVTVDPGDPNLKITLAWDDAPGTPNVSPALVNDLDLVVHDPNGTRYYPWTLDPLAPGVPAVQSAEDHLNNVEQVFVDAPIAGVWTVDIRGTSVPQGPQTFSLASSAPPIVTGIQMALVSSVPEYVPPGDPIDTTVRIEAVNENMVGMPQVNWRYDAGAFQSAPLTPLGGLEYEASLPNPSCGDTVEYYFSAEGDQTGVHLLPATAPGTVYSPTVGEQITPIYDDMETDTGWSVNPNGTDTATTGIWSRMIPEVTLAQPAQDVTPDPGYNCWITDGNAGSSLGANDVDGGATTLESPNFDLSGLSTATMGYWRWYSNDTGAAPNADTFVIDISDDGGASWVNLETIGPSGPGTHAGWNFHEFDVSTFVSLTSQVRLRFIASDYGTGSVIEAAVDDLRVLSEQCIAPPPPDCTADLNVDSAVDVLDFSIFTSHFGEGPGATPGQGDLNGDGYVNVLDFSAFAAQFGANCP